MESNMASSVNLGSQLEGFVSQLVKTGRYGSRSEVLREGIRIIHEREVRLAALDASILRAIDDVDHGRVYDLDAVAAALDAKYAGMAEGPNRP
jgi:antitoxin ParD1/3/4